MKKEEERGAFLNDTVWKSLRHLCFYPIDQILVPLPYLTTIGGLASVFYFVFQLKNRAPLLGRRGEWILEEN